MNPTPDAAEINKAMFMQLAMMLSTSAMQQLGKLMNPMTGKTEINLEAAQSTIDILVMLEAKTRGNLDREEERFIKNSLATLQLNYVETAQAAPAKPDAAPSPAPSETAQPASEPAPDAKPTDKEPKFRKSYG
jgi:polyhydroxyalkanoate synthesis regulator phasin